MSHKTTISPRNFTADDIAKIQEMQALVPNVVASVILYKTYDGWLNWDDLVSAGNEGLIRAYPRFDPKFGNSLKTHCIFAIKYAVIDEFNKLFPYSRRHHKQRSKINKVVEDLKEKLQRDPTPEEVYTTARMSKKKYELTMEATAPVFFDWIDAAPAEGEHNPHEQIKDFSALPPIEEIEYRDDLRQIREAMKRLNKRDRYIIEEMDFKRRRKIDVSSELGISLQQSVRVHKSALIHLAEIFTGTYGMQMPEERFLNEFAVAQWNNPNRWKKAA